MWTFKLSNGYKCEKGKPTKEEILFDIACIIRYHLVYFPGEDIDPVPDIFIYHNGKLDEMIDGENLRDEN